MTTGSIAITPGTGAYAAIYTIIEDALSKAVQRVALNDSAGNELSAGGKVLTADAAVLAKLDDFSQDQRDTGVYAAGREYETVAASSTAQTLGATGAVGNDLDGLLVIPATTSPGAISLSDGATSFTVFTGGTTSVSNLVPFLLPLGIKSISGAWKVSTGPNVSVIAIGNFT